MPASPSRSSLRRRISAAWAKPKERRWWIEMILDTTVAIAGLTFLSVAMHQSSIVFYDMRSQFEGQQEQEASLPLTEDTKGPRLFIRAHVDRRSDSFAALSVRPDDCIERITVNGTEMTGLPAADHFCFENGFQAVHLTPLLTKDRNDVEFTLRTGGGPAGLDVHLSLIDPLRVIYLCLILLVFVFYIVRLMRRLHCSKTTCALVGILLCGFFVRLVLSPAPGYSFDVGTNQGWARSAVELGAGKSYREQVGGTMLPNYPPLSLLIFEGSGHVYRTFFNHEFRMDDLSFRILIKLPAILADLLTAGLLFWMLRHRSKTAGVIAAGVFAFHPAAFYESAVWGQVDSIYTCIMVASIGAAAAKKPATAGALLAAALLCKLQAIVVLPTLFLWFMLQDKQSMIRFVAGGLTTACIVLLPFAPTYLPDILHVYTKSVGFYPSLGSGSYNLWQALTSNMGKSDAELLFGWLSYRQTGLLLFGFTLLVTFSLVWTPFARAARSKGRPEILLLTAAISAYAFFVLNTEMHERYLFPMIALGLPLIFLSWEGITLYALSSLAFFLNLVGVLRWTRVDDALFREFSNLPAFIGAAHVFLLVLWIIIIARAALRPPSALADSTRTAKRIPASRA